MAHISQPENGGSRRRRKHIPSRADKIRIAAEASARAKPKKERKKGPRERLLDALRGL